jgi:multidrug efflux system outer membrane protein
MSLKMMTRTMIMMKKYALIKRKEMNRSIIKITFGVIFLSLVFTACKTPSLVERSAQVNLPDTYNASEDTTNNTKVHWKDYFQDQYLIGLIDTALSNNQELNIVLQEIAISANEVQAKQGEILPSVGLKAGGGLEKNALHTPLGANEEYFNEQEERNLDSPVPDLMVGAVANWEVDIWRKLRNSKKSAVKRYMSSIEGKNFLVTNLVAEIANAYYELLALDNQLAIVKRNIEIQSNALEIVKLQKQAAKVTELAVRKFEAEVFHTRSLQYDIQQRIYETENELNYLVGRYPQPIERDAETFNNLMPDTIQAGVPSQLLENRPDVREAALNLEAAKLDVKVAKARFYPSLDISAAIGLQAFNPSFLVKTPESMLYSLAGELAAPLINRKAIKAEYKSANSRQIQAVIDYERTVLNAYIEVANQLSNIGNLQSSYDLKSKEVDALTESITIANTLFRSARADYMEVLLTQRDALESKFELVETKMQRMNARVNVYRALGGGWQN